MIDDPNSNLLAINTGAGADYMAYQFKYDMIINGQRVKTTPSRNPSEIPWKDLGVEYLCESTGVFLTSESAKAHVDAGVKKVIFSTPAKDDSPTIVMGVNEAEYKPDMQYVSCASCT